MRLSYLINRWNKWLDKSQVPTGIILDPLLLLTLPEKQQQQIQPYQTLAANRSSLPKLKVEKLTGLERGLQILIVQSWCRELCASWKPRAGWLCVAASLCACLYLLLLAFVQQRCVTLFSSSQTSTTPLLMKKMFLISQWIYSNKRAAWRLAIRDLYLLQIQGAKSQFAAFIRTLMHFISCLHQSDEAWCSFGL